MANFGPAVKKVFKNEGYGQVVTDSGGLTKWGISQKAYPNEDILSMTEEKAAAIYKRDYWDKVWGDRINDQMTAEALFDWAVNAGPGRAIKTVQEALNSTGSNLKVDGGMGPMTLNALNRADSKYLLPHFVRLRIAFYEELARNNPAKYEKYLKGWIKRAKEFLPENAETLLPLVAMLAAVAYYYFSNKKGSE